MGYFSVIVCNDLKDGNKLLDNILAEVKFKDIEHMTKGNIGSRVSLKTGETYVVIRASESMRGHKIDKAYIHRDVSNYFVDTIIKPSFYGDVDIVYF